MLRIIHKAEDQKISTTHKSFSSISRIIRLANMHSDAKMVFDMRKTLKADGNLVSLYAGLNFNLNKSRNYLTIWPRKACSVRVKHELDLFGYYSSWERHIDKTFESGGTKAFAFNRHDEDSFRDYLLFEAFRQDWKGLLPCHYKYDVKIFLKELFKNACEHSNSDSPIFVSSSYDGEFLKFTLVDCGEGFLSRVHPYETENICESDAISWAMSGKSIRGIEGSQTLKSLGKYCSDNEGELLIISGGSTVLFCKDGFHKNGLLPGPFRGSIINLSVKIKRREFAEKWAA